MNVRENLLRLYRWRLQERQDYLAGLESLRERLHNDARRLREEAAEGASLTSFVENDAGNYPLLVRPLIERQRKIERSIAELEHQIADARAAVTAARQEVRHRETASGPHPPDGTLRMRRRRRGGALV
jgi:type II secretory pathway component PulM